jgi:hypothetical protein
VIRNKFISNSSTNREFVYHPITSGQIQVAVETICDWFFLSEELSAVIKYGFIVVLVAAMVIGFIVLVRVSKKLQSKTASMWGTQFFFLSTLFIFIYVAVLLFSISFIDAHTPLSARILSPLYVIGVAGISCGIHSLLSTIYTGRKIASIILLIYTSFTIVQLVNINTYVDDIKTNGRGFSSRIWKEAKILKFIKTLPSDICIYSNGPDALELFMGFRSTFVPRQVHPDTRKKNGKFEIQMRDMVKELIEKDGVLIYFRYITWRWYLPKNVDLERFLRLQTLYKGNDGAVYKIDQ